MSEARKAATRPVGNARIQRDGSIVAESTLSPESFVVGAEVWIPPRKVIPIVFLPGIMGSNLKVKPGTEETVRKRMGPKRKKSIPTVWSPPNGLVGGISGLLATYGRSSQARQALLSGDTTVVDDAGFLDTQVQGLPLSNLTSRNDEEARFRGWGTVHWSSYGEFLLYLERELRNLQDPRLFLNPNLPIAMLDDPWMHAAAEWWPLLHAGDAKKSKAPAAFKVTKDDLKRMSKHWFPVYACGYNWVNSNAESGQNVLDTIEKIIQTYTKLKGPSGKPLFECEKVILVTHSMGGLVGRWAAKHDSNKRILGVVHGVQPATGAPLAYRRAVAGTEPGGLAKWGLGVFIGKNRAESMPIVCNSPGSLQLLPNKLYPKGWLQLEREVMGANGRQQKTISSLPESDPYQEIYREKEAWWRLADPEMLDPAKRFTDNKQDPWNKGFLEFIREAESFHVQLSDYYHPKTYVCYGDDPDYVTFGTVRWRVHSIDRSGVPALKDDEIKKGISIPAEELRGHRIVSDDMEQLALTGCCFFRPPRTGLDKKEYGIADNRALLQPPDAPGDGTVSWQSGEAPGKASPQGKTFALRGYDHQGCYNSDGPRQFTLWAIARLVGEMG